MREEPDVLLGLPVSANLMFEAKAPTRLTAAALHLRRPIALALKAEILCVDAVGRRG